MQTQVVALILGTFGLMSATTVSAQEVDVVVQTCGTRVVNVDVEVRCPSTASPIPLSRLLAGAYAAPFQLEARYLEMGRLRDEIRALRLGGPIAMFSVALGLSSVAAFASFIMLEDNRRNPSGHVLTAMMGVLLGVAIAGMFRLWRRRTKRRVLLDRLRELELEAATER